MFFYVILLFLLVLRAVEVVFVGHVAFGEILKAIYIDITLVSFLSIIGWIIFSVSKKIIGERINVILLLFLCPLLLFSALVVGYYVKVKIPFDTALFNIPDDELQFMVKPFMDNGVSISVGLIISLIFLYYSTRKATQKWIFPLKNGVLLLELVGTVLFAEHCFNGNTVNTNPSVENKTVYFARSVVDFLALSGKEETNRFYFREDYWKFKTKATRITSKEYPLLHRNEYENVLGNYFNLKKQPPNIVFIVVESLSKCFQGKNALYGSFTPFLDSLADESVYFTNFLSTAERTFNALPSSLGSLPYGDKGFAEIGFKRNLPNHYSIQSILKQNNYSSYFFCGVWNVFNNMDGFITQQGGDINNVWDESYCRWGPKVQGFSWGYDDQSLLKKYAFDSKTRTVNGPFIDVILTMTMHGPFLMHDKSYAQKFDKHIKGLEAAQREKAASFKTELSTVLYTDHELQQLFKQLATRPEFDNTIFVIYGDHGMPELVEYGAYLERFHTPLIIYSRLLKGPKVINAVSTQLDLAPSILALLETKYQFAKPEKVAWIGNGIDTLTTFRCRKQLPIMRNSRMVVEYLSGRYFLMENELFYMNPDLSVRKIENEAKKKELQKALRHSLSMNHYTCLYDKIIPKSDYLNFHKNVELRKTKMSEGVYKGEFPSLISVTKLSDSVNCIKITWTFEYLSKDDFTIKNSPHLIYCFQNPTIIDWQSMHFESKGLNKWHKVRVEKQIPYYYYKKKGITELAQNIWNQEKIRIKFRNIKLSVELVR